MGNNIFSNGTNMNTAYIPNFFQPKYPCKEPNSGIQQNVATKPYEVRDVNQELVGYFWYFGNSVDLVFNLTGTITSEPDDTYISVNDVLNSLDIKAAFYDFRMDKVLEYSNAPNAEYKLIVAIPNTESVDGATITISIDNEASQKLVRGTYRLELVASHISGYNETLFSTRTCTFEVR